MHRRIERAMELVLVGVNARPRARTMYTSASDAVAFMYVTGGESRGAAVGALSVQVALSVNTITR